MSKVSRSVFTAFKNLFFSTGSKANFVGSDHHGNRYFEIKADGTQRASRFIEEPKDMDYRDQFEIPEIPVEWESWLRKKRNDPPTQEEIQRNYTRMMQTKLRAQKLDESYGTKQIDSNDGSALPITENVTAESHQSQFPTYPEFEIKPGHKNER